MSAETLRKAADLIRIDQRFEVDLGHIGETEYATWLVVADWLEDQATVWAGCLEMTQRPGGFEDPGGIFQGRPDEAAENAAWHVRHALAAARAYLGGAS